MTYLSWRFDQHHHLAEIDKKKKCNYTTRIMLQYSTTLCEDREVAGSTPASKKCCVLEQDTLSTLLSISFFPGRPVHNTHKKYIDRYVVIK